MPRSADSIVLELDNEISAIQKVVDYVVGCCEPACRNRRRLLLNFRVGLTEALSNAVLYGNRGDPKKRVRVELWLQSGEIRARVTDEGQGFDPGSVPDPRTPGNLAKPGGRGIFLMRKLMDEVYFNASGNAVTLVLRDAADIEAVELP